MHVLSSSDTRTTYTETIQRLKLQFQRFADSPSPWLRYTLSHEIANLYTASGDRKEAISWYERALASLREYGGPPSTDLAILLWKLGRHDDSRAQFKGALAHYENALGPDASRQQISKRDKEMSMSYLWLEDYKRAGQIASDYIDGRRGFGREAALYIAISIVVDPLANADKNAIRAAIQELDERFPRSRSTDPLPEMEVRRFANIVLEELESQRLSE